ncbi:right-handed parallel beta-helix repeat-containing protein [candidate division KSB1 bacterium]|nr:right-handed parallel beta-helix repeat-containing protein [candidate division KSB1 bacterium]
MVKISVLFKGIVLAGLFHSLLVAKTSLFNIEDFGAVPDNGIVCTKAIQSAISQCHLKGGGTVFIPAGEFISGTIFLEHNVNLHLAAGAVLKGSPNLDDYLDQNGRFGLIRAWGKRNISITGQGEINGNGTIFFDPEKPHLGPDFDRQYTRQGEKYMTFENGIQDGPIAYEARPGMLVVLLRCEDVTIQDVTFRDSPSWTFRIGDCDGVIVHGINITNNLLIPNSDGIHCTTSRNVRISDCDIRCGDDAIIVTGFGDEITVGGDDSRSDIQYSRRAVGNKTGYAENIVVTNCTLQSRSSGIRVGYGNNSIRFCVFSNLVIYESNRGLGIFARDAGSIENILFSNITIQTRLHTGHWWGNGEPIHLSAIAQNKTIPVGSIVNVRFKNIIAQGESGMVVYGEKPDIIQDVTFDDIQLELVQGDHSQTYGGNFDLRPVADVQDAIFEHDVAGLYAQNVTGLSLSNIKITAKKSTPFLSYGLECHDINRLFMKNITGDTARFRRGEFIHLVDCANVTRE